MNLHKIGRGDSLQQLLVKFLSWWEKQSGSLVNLILNPDLLSAQFSRLVMSDLSTPWTAANQASLSITNSWSLLKLMSIEWVIHPTVSSSIIPFSSSLQSFPASGSFPMSQFFTSGGQSIEVSASASVLPMNIQD